MALEPLSVLVWAAYPALRTGIAELLRGAGLAPCEVASLAALDGRGAAADVLVADVADGDAVDDVLRSARALALPVLFTAPDDFGPPAKLLDRDVGHGWVSRAATADDLAAALRAVVAGFVVVEPGSLRPPRGAAVDGAAAGGGGPLTPRELEVLRWLALGLPNKAIALKLGISEHTVKFHVGSVLSKLDAGSRTEAVTTAARRGLLTL